MTPALPIAAAFALVLAAGAARNLIFPSSCAPPPIGGGGLSVGAGDWRQASSQRGETPGLAAAGPADAGAASAKTGGPDRLSSPSSPVGAAGVSTGAAASTGERRDCNRGEALDAGQPAGEQPRPYTGREQSLCGFDSHRPHSVLLDAIRHCESAGSDVSRPNHAGALGPYQFLRPTWNDHARGVPWSMATDEPTARVVAARYLAWIERTLTKWQGRPATVEQVCGAWHSGIGNLRRCGYDVSKLGPEGRGFVRKVIERMEVHGGE